MAVAEAMRVVTLLAANVLAWVAGQPIRSEAIREDLFDEDLFEEDDSSYARIRQRPTGPPRGGQPGYRRR